MYLCSEYVEEAVRYGEVHSFLFLAFEHLPRKCSSKQLRFVHPRLHGHGRDYVLARERRKYHEQLEHGGGFDHFALDFLLRGWLQPRYSCDAFGREVLGVVVRHCEEPVYLEFPTFYHGHP